MRYLILALPGKVHPKTKDLTEEGGNVVQEVSKKLVSLLHDYKGEIILYTSYVLAAIQSATVMGNIIGCEYSPESTLTIYSSHEVNFTEMLNFIERVGNLSDAYIFMTHICYVEYFPQHLMNVAYHKKVDLIKVNPGEVIVLDLFLATITKITA